MPWFRKERPGADPVPAPEEVEDSNLVGLLTGDLVHRVAEGHVQALGEIWRRHYRRMLAMARRDLDRHRDLRIVFGADDLVSEVAARVTYAALTGKLQGKLSSREEFWCLFRDVLRQCIRQEEERRSAIKRGGDGIGNGADREPGRRGRSEEGRDDTALADDLDLIASREPMPDAIVWMEEILARLFAMLDRDQTMVAALLVKGDSVPEIAQSLGHSDRTISRRVAEIRAIWNRSVTVYDP